MSEDAFESPEVTPLLEGRVASTERLEAVNDLAAKESLPGGRPRGPLDGGAVRSRRRPCAMVSIACSPQNKRKVLLVVLEVHVGISVRPSGAIPMVVRAHLEKRATSPRLSLILN